MGLKNVTAEEIMAAMEANGYEQAFGEWFTYKNNSKFFPDDSNNPVRQPVVAACFMGQIALNLGVERDSIAQLFDSIYGSKNGHNLCDDIINWNDKKMYPYKKILGFVKKRLAKDPLNKVYSMYEEEVGQLAIKKEDL